MAISGSERFYLALRSIMRSWLALYEAFRTFAGGKSKRHEWPSRRTQLYVAGYPRSGNTYTSFWIQKTAPELRVSSHFHMVATLRKALKLNTNVLWVIREPRQAIASYAIYRRGHTPARRRRSTEFYAEMALRDYLDYFRFALQHIDRMFVVEFEMTVNRPEQVLAMIQSHFSLLQDVDEEMVAKACEERLQFMRTDDRDVSIRSGPSEEKEKLKDGIREYLFAHPGFKAAEEYYQTALARARATEEAFVS